MTERSDSYKYSIINSGLTGLGLQKPIAVYSRDQVIPFIDATGFKLYTVEDGDGEIRIKLRK